ncbi:MAG: hypothetical protein EPN70_03420 [Paraburkholderia sp.]|uniref:hypothetical protein n=1 Tax=Paraburkholderia sp. TaxID=1926495 RepID=UPI0011F4B9A5|nr:hypothetical protein [Paraburkholderia sp.]TAM07234.1 MAG: hypothetical protein EPN70_03420 [Paraburkholderia sp.]TAM32627.1 MAG: hypothetical protein EPN59_01640 [Paraburkholderia sp.]
MTPTTPARVILPPEKFDRYAWDVARGIADIDRSKLKPAQFVDAVQHAVLSAIQVAAEPIRPAITIRCAEIQLNAPGLALTDAECEVLRGIAERMRRVEEARRAEVATC